MEKRDNQYLRAFGENLRKIRLEKGFSQESLAAEADSVLSQVGRIERGQRAPNLLTIKKLADALGVRPMELLNFN